MSAVLESTIDILSQLVGFNTVSDRSNQPLIEHVKAYLDRHGIPCAIAPNAGGDKATLFATIGPQVDGGVVLSGHVDTVPVAGQLWSGDPFTLRRTDDRLYGRGACDMKGFAAVALALAPELSRMRLAKPIHIMLSYDEETTCLGVVDTIAAMGVSLPRPGAVIVGEPTEMRVVDAHKGVATFHTTVTGFEVHSSKPQLGVNAVLVAARIIVFLEELHAELRGRGDPSGRFDPPWSTIHVGTIAGGNARNITARECKFHWEFRALPDLDDAEIPARLARWCDEVLLPPLRQVSPQADVVTVEEINVPGLAPDPGSAAERLAMRLTGSNHTETVPYGSEAGRFQRAGLATVLCGPGNINQAHQPDEWIAISELVKCIAFVRGVAAELAG